MKTAKPESSTLSELVSRDFRAGAIFDRYGLDYCCGGARSLAEGCRQRGVNLVAVLSELEALDPESRERVAHDSVALIDYIVLHHHAYVRAALPVIEAHLTKVVAAHGANHTELTLVESVFSKAAKEFSQHMVKEEQVLFPHIRALADAVRLGGPPPPDMFGTVQNPIRMMEIEHEIVSDALTAIRGLTGGYQPPPDACPTYGLVLDEIAAFERDFDAHVHLENQVLYPEAIRLESALEHATRGLKCEHSE